MVAPFDQRYWYGPEPPSTVRSIVPVRDAAQGTDVEDATRVIEGLILTVKLFPQVSRYGGAAPSGSKMPEILTL